MSNHKGTILIVDDNTSNLLALMGLLESDNVTIRTADNGIEALKIALNEPPDLIILDVKMPEMDGFEVAQILKSNKRTAEIPIIFASAEKTELESVLKGYEEGAVDYMSKPFDPELVKAKVKVLLKLQLQKKELIEANKRLQISDLVINNSPDVIGIIDEETFAIEEVNHAVLTVLGFTREEATAMTLLDFLNGGEKDTVLKLKEAGLQSFSFETQTVCRNLDVKYFQWKVVVKFGKWFFNAHDLTEIKEAEMLRTHLAAVVEQSGDAIYIQDEDGKIIAWNQGASNIYGYSQKEAIELSSINLVPVEDQKKYHELISQISAKGSVNSIEAVRVNKRGERINVLFSASRITDPVKKRKGIAITEKDITELKKVERTLKENEFFLRSVLSQMHDGVIVIDSHGHVMLLNPAAEQIFGKRAGDGATDEWIERFGLYHSNRKRLYRSEELPIIKALSGASGVNVEMFVLNSQNKEGRFILTSSNPLHDADGNTIGAMTVFADITERKNAENALIESEKRFHDLFDFSPVPMCVYDNETLEILEVNESVEKTYKCISKDLLQKKITDLVEEERKDELMHHLKEIVAGTTDNREWVHRLCNGEEIVVELYGQDMAFLGRNTTLVVINDVTYKRKIERQLNEANIFLRSVIDNIPHVVFVKDAKSLRYVKTNPATKKLLGIQKGEAKGKTDFDLFPSNLAKKLREADTKVINTKAPVDIPEESIPTTSGKRLYHTHKIPILTGEGTVSHILGIAEDITERKASEQELKKAKELAESLLRTQEIFVANISHEIRTPMNAIMGFVSVLQRTPLSEEQREYLDAVENSSEILLEIINDILDMSKIESGLMTLESIPFNIQDLLESLHAMLLPRAQEKGIRLKINVKTDVPELLAGDPTRLNQILLNLTYNAIKFTEKGEVVIEVQAEPINQEEVMVCFKVRDTGIGIPENKIGQIFDRFSQANIDTTRKFGGTGLGLNIVKNLVEMQGGQVSVKSIEGVGSEFEVKIPYQLSAPRTLEDQLHDAHKAAIPAGTRILLVEDNILNQKLLHAVLKPYGIEIVTTKNGKEALAVLQESVDFDLIIMDLQMPEMDGYTATENIRKSISKTIPIIAMTANALPAEKERCLSHGMNDYVSKPFNEAVLLNKISYYKNYHDLLKRAAEEGVVNLAYLRGLSAGNKSFIKEIVETFISAAPQTFQRLKAAVEMTEFAEIKSESHTLKSMVSYLGITVLAEKLQTIEDHAQAAIVDYDYHRQIMEIEIMMTAAISEARTLLSGDSLEN